MGIASRELQHCNNRNSESRASLLELCRAPAVVDEVNAATVLSTYSGKKNNPGKMKNFL